MTNPNLSPDYPDFLTDETLHEAYELEIESQNGESVRFGELVAGKGNSITTIVIFGGYPRLQGLYRTQSTSRLTSTNPVRHFFCLYDQDYVRTLAGQVTGTLLDTVPSSAKPAQAIIIGCGHHSLIVPYMEETSDKFPIYSDPSAKIYEKLRMKRTMDGFTSPPPYSYAPFSSALAGMFKQIWRRGWSGLRGGNWVQQGGEWIFQHGKLRYAHRMEGVNDHLTADQLVNILKADQDHSSSASPTAVKGQDERERETGLESDQARTGNMTSWLLD